MQTRACPAPACVPLLTQLHSAAVPFSSPPLPTASVARPPGPRTLTDPVLAQYAADQPAACTTRRSRPCSASPRAYLDVGGEGQYRHINTCHATRHVVPGEPCVMGDPHIGMTSLAHHPERQKDRSVCPERKGCYACEIANPLTTHEDTRGARAALLPQPEARKHPAPTSWR